MSSRLGIGILDLLPQTTALAPSIPDGVVETIGVLTVVDHRCTSSADFFLHEGVLQSAADALDLSTKDWPIHIPGLTQGLPFRLAVARNAAPAGQQEPAPARWILDIEVTDLAVQIPRVRPALRSGGSGVTPLTLTPDLSKDAPKNVYLAGSTVIRISGGGAGGTQVQLADTPDPLDPDAPTGAVIHLTAKPPDFLLGSSGHYGLTLNSFDIDLSPGYTPAAIMARGHDETWQGVAFRDATFFFPPSTPLVHSLSVGVRDVIIGTPGGLQGQLSVEFGQDFADVPNTRITMQLQTSGTPTTLATSAGASATSLVCPVSTVAFGQTRRVRAVFNVDAPTTIPGHTDLAVVGVYWKLPDGSEGNSTTTPWFIAPVDGTLSYRLRTGAPTNTATATPPSQVPADQTELVEVSVTFPRQEGSPTGTPPIVDLTVAGSPTMNNVLHLRGARASLAGLVFQARNAETADWLLGAGTAPRMVRHATSFSTPLLPDGTTTADLLVEGANGARRIRLDVVPGGPLVVGHQTSTDPASTGVVTVIGTGAVTPNDVDATFLAAAFELRNQRDAAPSAATISGTAITVPQGVIAEVEVNLPAGLTDPLPAPTPADPPTRTVQILFEFGTANVVNVLRPNEQDSQLDPAHEPDALPIAHGGDPVGGGAASAQIAEWLALMGPPNGRKFFILGRTDDLAQNAIKAENDTYNAGLALARAGAAQNLLIGAGISAGDISVFAEPSPVAGAPSGIPPRFTDAGRLALPAAHVAGTHPVWNDRWTADTADNTTRAAAINDPRRPPYRCAEIFCADTGAAVVPPPAQPSPETVVGRILVPGPDGPPVGSAPATTSTSPPTDYRVRLQVTWDSPTVVTAADAIPTKAEALIAWKAAQVELPATSSGTPPPVPPPTGPDFWQVLLDWSYDSRTGETEASGALSLPDGTLTWQSDLLAGAFGFGPAILALAGPDSVSHNAGADFVALAEVLVLGAAVGALLNTGTTPGSVDIDGFAIDYKWNGAAHVAATVDYTVELRINVSVSGAGSLIGHLRLRYKGVGLRFDGKPEGGLAGVALTYDGLSVQVVDPGSWSLGGPLGQLIRIASSRIGNGSQWMEFDLQFALDLGVVRLDGAVIRLVLEPFSVELRGLTASLNIPGTITGKGSVTIGDGGSFRALLGLQVIPAKLGAYGALAVDQDFVSIEVGVQLPVGIPLGGTGFGIFGFVGRFVANGTRNLDGLTNTDPVQKQLDWYDLSPEQKYKRLSGQFAFGVGAVVGTLPDGAFTFNAEGSLTIGFPDVSVVFGIDAHLITSRKSPASAQGGGNASSFRILGMVLIEPDSIMVAVRATYQIPKVLTLQVPISAYFPLSGGDAWYIRIGTDNDATRPGSPVTITLLPSILDVRAWAFVMIEERGLHHLGGTLVPVDLATPLDFDGFSIGMGAGFDLKWSAGPFKLEITAFLLVGVGTKPLLLAGAAGIKGELDLVVVSVGVDGVIEFHISDDATYLDGHFCGHVDFFFFSVSGCVDIHIGDTPGNAIPVPDSPLLGIDLCDHLAIVKGKASKLGDAAGTPVWPDTTPVLRFAHYVEDGLGATSDFVRKLSPPAALSPWSGSTELKYAFRLSTLELWKLTGADPNAIGDWTKIGGPLDSAWWLPTHRAAVIEGGNAPGPSTEEGRELGLLNQDPRAWSRWLGDGSQNQPGDPANTVGTVCDGAKPADPACAYGKDRVFALGKLGSFVSVPDPGSVFPSRFTLFATLPAPLDAALLAQLGADAGWVWSAGQVAPLHGAITLHGQALTQGFRFPEWWIAGRIVATAPILLVVSKPLQSAELVLEVCAETTRGNVTSQCDFMPAKDGALTDFAGAVTGAKYSSRGMTAFASGVERALRLDQLTLDGGYPGTTDQVAVDIDPADGTVELVVLGSTGAQLAATQSVGKGRQWLRAAAAGITGLTLKAKDKAIVYEVCWGSHPAILDLVPIVTMERPLVIASNIHGKTLTLVGEVVPPTQNVAAIVVPRVCSKLRYVLPAGDGWTQISIAPWTRGDITLVACCGVTMEAAAAQAQDAGFRASLIGLLQGLVLAGTTNQPVGHVYLDASSTYEIRAGWQWQGFKPANPGDDPPPTTAGTWSNGGQDHYRFATAAFGLTPPPAAVESASLDTDPALGGPGFDERSFDPRGITRYLTAAFPTHEDPPHFLDDPVGFWFMVDHLEPLVEKYARILQVKVLETRPPAGALHGAPPHISGAQHILDVTQTVAWKVDTASWFAADHRLVQAVEAAPCLGGAPALGSSNVSVTADLKPRSEYDLLLNAAPQTVGAFAEVPVARSHFRTSRYRNPTQMLGGLGFTATIGFGTLTDTIAAGTLAAGSLQIGDTALDAALTALGLDPWPLPAAPRSTVIWRRPSASGQAWTVVAVLLEADEPVFRAGLATGAIGETPPPPRLEVASVQIFRTFEHTVFVASPPSLKSITSRLALGPLAERVRNEAGTRMLFVPAVPIAVSGGRLYDLAVQLNEKGAAGASGIAPMTDRPMSVAQEGE